MLLILGLNFRQFFKQIKKIRLKNWLFISVLTLFINEIVKNDQLAVSWLSAKILLIFFTIKIIKIDQKILKTSLLSSLIFQSLLAFYQFFFQQQLFGYLFLGETNLEQYYNLAKGWQEKILAYGTTAHPNVLAGWAVLSWWLLIKKTELNKYWKTISTICVIAILLFTQSISALLAFLLALLTIFLKLNNKTLLILSSIIIISAPVSIGFLAKRSNNPSIWRRHYLNQAAINMIKNKPLFGVGINHFTIFVEKFAEKQEIVRFVQPAHHFLLLWTAETGILGILILILIILQLWQNKQQTELLTFLLIISPILALDHYLLTISTGQLTLFLGLKLIKTKKQT